MKASFILLILLLSTDLQAQQPAEAHYAVETAWPGVLMQVLDIKRIPEDRIMMLVRLTATEKAAASTLIGVPVPIPANASKEEIEGGAFTALPFSFAKAILTDDLTGQQHPAVPPSHDDIVYAPSEVMMPLKRGQSFVIEVRFQNFLLPTNTPSGTDKQTVTLFLPNAKKPIAKIPLPAATPTRNPTVH